MLYFELIGKHEGLRVLGPSDTFRGFQEIVHDVNERSPLVRDKEGVFLALAYDFRKAFEGQRIVRKPKKFDELAGPLVGVDILWPTILVQCRTLRASLGFIDTSKRHHAFAYTLEAIVEEGLKQEFAHAYEEIYAHYLALQPEHPWLEEKCSSRIEHWDRWTKPQRRQRLVQLLDSLDPMFEFEYKMRVKNGEIDLLSPDEWDAVESET